jgi:magnesium chelatase subunit D
MSLRHRLRRDALEETVGAERIEQALDQVFGKAKRAARDDQSSSGDDSSGDEVGDDFSGDDAHGERINGNRRKDRGDRAAAASSNGGLNSTANGALGAEAPSQPSESAVKTDMPRMRFNKRVTKPQTQAKLSTKSSLPSSRKHGGKKAAYSDERGRYARSVTSQGRSGKLALDATLRAAAGLGFKVRSLEGSNIATTPSPAIPVSALRFKLFKRKQGRLFIFALDLSGSMALKRLGHAKGAILALLRESYIQRDSVAIVGFRGTSAELLLPPSRSILRASRALDSVGVGGGTPLSAGLACALNLSKRVGSRAGEIFLLVFTDGQANVPLKSISPIDRSERQRQIDLEITQLGAALKHAGVTTVVISTHDRYRSNDAVENIAAKLDARSS